MRDLFEEHQAYMLAGQALPTPTDTPYSRSRISSHHGTPTPSNPSSSPPPLPPDFGKNNEPGDNDDELSVLDPRRFTPTLHASLVSEILSLRREVDSKDRFIENLEQTLQTSRSENENLEEKVAEASKENRAARRQLKQVEDGTMAALQELANERDDLKNSQKDLRNKLEVSQKSVKTQEQDSERAHNIHIGEKSVWDKERRALERRVHVAESRLKTFIDEVNAQHAAEFQHEHDEVSEIEEDSRDSGLGNDSDVTSAHSSPSRQMPERKRSIGSTRRSSTRQSNRFSLDSIFTSGRQSRQNGVSLADELVFDEEDEDLDDLEEIEDEYADHETRLKRARESRQSFNQDDKAKRVLGLLSGRESSLDQNDSSEYERRDMIHPIQEVPTPKDDAQSPIELARPLYVDSCVQYSPPVSPTLPTMVPTSPLTSLEAASVLSEKALPTPEVEANQSRKRVASPVRTSNSRPLTLMSEKSLAPAIAMVSSATQTSEEQPTAKLTFVDVSTQANPPQIEAQSQPPYNTASTQTDDANMDTTNQLHHGRAPPPASLIIPSIAIHPPLSSPPSPREAVLPPATKNAACQVAIEKPVHAVDVGTQTDRITIDQRLLKLPPHLWPSAIKNKDANLRESPSMPDARAPQSIIKQASGNELRPLSQSSARPGQESSSSAATEDRYPGNNDNGPVSPDGSAGPRRPFRSTSLFAGFDDEEVGDETDLDEPTPQVKSRPAPKSTPASRLARSGFSFSDPPTPVPEERESPHSDAKDKNKESELQDEIEDTIAERPTSPRRSFERAARVAKPIRMTAMAKPPNLRRSSLIANGTATHLRQGSRTPSEQSFGSTSVGSSMAPPPPFPVPARSSSRRVWHTRSEGSYSPTPGQSGAFSGRRAQADPGKQHPGKATLRKVRSANVIPRRNGRGTRPRSRSPPSSFQSSMPSPTLAEHDIPEMPRDNIKSPRHVFELQKSHDKAARPDVISRTRSGSGASSSQQQSTVVDAIAVTMVGEWMWKYVRRRKSFGVPESPTEVSKPGEDGSITVTSNGQRHKRWVWLSPYERSVMWSGKQPSSNSALMGKSGRKLIIQSVLDVKDDTPAPKNSGPIFNRSILILTPARALKFTAISSERHYLWLTALSFLSHHPSQRLSPLPAIPVPEPKSIKVPEPSEISSPVEPKIPIPEKEPEKPARATAMLRRTPLRDSVRIAKDRAGVSPHRRPRAPFRNATAPPTLPETREAPDVAANDRVLHSATGTAFFEKIYTEAPSSPYRFADHLPADERRRPGTAGTTATADSAAEYPTVPRYYGHGRKRSASTGGPAPPSFRDIPTSSGSNSGRLGSLRGWSQWPEKLAAVRPMSRDGVISEVPHSYAELNESTTTIAPPPIPLTRPRSHTSAHHAHAAPPVPAPVPASQPQPQQAQAPPSTASSSRNGTMRMEAFVEPPARMPPPLPRTESEPVVASAGKSGSGGDAVMGWPERMRTGRRLPGLGVRRRSRVPDAWTKGVVVAPGEGAEGEGGLGDPFRGF
ncbi:MAG: hypothetical protein M1822_008044 [Bathelium mastoideum]|nr:MAG: hypothetical protein M1822_008044 [Bathelium mastoideum]